MVLQKSFCVGWEAQRFCFWPTYICFRPTANFVSFKRDECKFRFIMKCEIPVKYFFGGFIVSFMIMNNLPVVIHTDKVSSRGFLWLCTLQLVSCFVTQLKSSSVCRATFCFLFSLRVEQLFVATQTTNFSSLLFQLPAILVFAEM